MCNVAFHYDKKKKIAGGAWVLRNERGVVLFHSRRSFAGIGSNEEAKSVILLWAVESMKSQCQTKVIFAGEFDDLFGAVTRPDAWPSFLFQGSEILKELKEVGEYELKVVNKQANRGAFFIAQSVSKQGFVHSYVEAGHPSWLFEFFVNEMRDL